MFQFPGFPAHGYFIHHALHDSSSWGFPHSDIRGSKLICSSPRLFAACHVLRRLPMPRHPPYALLRLNYLPDASRLLPLVLASLELLCFIPAVFLWQNCFFYPTEKPDLGTVLSFRIIPFFLLVSLSFLSCMPHMHSLEFI